MPRATQLVVVAVLGACLAHAAPVSGVTVGQIDTFEDGTTANWVVGLLGGVPPPAALPTNIASGGPAGADDNYLQLTALGGAGAGSRLTAINVSQWAGAYTAAGVTTISMDLRNLGPTDLSIRLYLENPMGAPPTDTALTSAISLPVGGGWVHAEFAIDPASLLALAGDATTLLSDVTVLRIIHNPLSTFPGPSVVAVLGVDNIAAQARAVPEPGTLALAAVGLAGLAAWGRRIPRSPRAPADP